MSLEKIDDRIIQEFLDVLKARIDRFFFECDPKWPKKDIIKHMRIPLDLNDPRIQKVFREWEKAGIIRFKGEDECYFEVLKCFPAD